MPGYFRLMVNALLIFMAVMTIGSIVGGDLFPSFTKCISVVAILILVKKSADNVGQYRKDI